jgi:hypothetical protein
MTYTDKRNYRTGEGKATCQACGNSSAWVNEQLKLDEFKEKHKCPKKSNDLTKLNTEFANSFLS